MHIIKQYNEILAIRFSMGDIPEGLNFINAESDFIQVGSWRYCKGKNLAAHKHNIVPRTVTRTQEFIFVLKGSLKAIIYAEDESFVEEVILNALDGMIMLSGCHGYQILEDDTVVLETKNGPYLGAEIDRKRI